jgi:ABC-type polysaccharide/polyol phosphate export permease
MSKMPDRMAISLKGRRMLTKNHIMLLEMLANTNWERPLYMSTTVGSDNYVGLEPFFLQEGLAYRITPFNFRELGIAPQGGYAVDSETMYDNLMNRFAFGGMKNPGIYIDETITRMGYTHRRLYTMLANQLIREGKKEKALAVLNKCDEEFPASILPHNYWQSQSHLIGQAYLTLGEKEKGTIEQINVTPIGRFEFIFSKLIPYWVVGLFIMGYSMLLAKGIYGLVPVGNIGLLMLFASLFILVVSSFGLLVSNYSETTQQAALMMLFFLIIFILTSGLLTPISSMPLWAQTLTYLNPLRYFIEVLRAIYLKGSGFTDLVSQFVALCVYASVIWIWAIRSYKKNG